jgi:hypothetical protein
MRIRHVLRSTDAAATARASRPAGSAVIKRHTPDAFPLPSEQAKEQPEASIAVHVEIVRRSADVEAAV